jgi:GxxExxY protein
LGIFAIYSGVFTRLDLPPLIYFVRKMEELNAISRAIIGAAIEVHKRLGPGLLESTYHACLVYELEALGFYVQTQVPLPLIYKGIKLDVGYRLDILVNGKVVVELKAVEALTEVHTAQVLTYLKLSGSGLGLLINFNVCRLKEGIKRLIRSENIQN